MSEEMTRKLIDLEIRLTEQDATIDALNETVHQHWQMLDKLTKQHDRLNERFAAIEDDLDASGSAGAPPPHY